MSIAFEVRVHDGYVELACTGTYTFESSLQVFSEAFVVAEREGRAATMVDGRGITGDTPTLLERYQQATHVAALQSGPGPRVRFALVGREPLIHPQRFGEVIARSRGALARVFTDPEEAIAWLTG